MHDRIAKNLADIGAVSLDDYIDGRSVAQYQLAGEIIDGNAVTRLHQACQRAFRNTDPLKFEFIEQPGSTSKQCILTITKPDGVRRSYATQPVFAKKADAKLEAAKIAIDLGALDFLTSADRQIAYALDPVPPSVEPSSVGNATPSEAMSAQSTPPESFVDDIDTCCSEWRAGHITPKWVPFFDPKSPQKQGCALRIQLSSHVSRIYLSDSTLDTYLVAQGACAKAAVSQGVLEFIKHGNGQTRPSSPIPSTSPSSHLPPVNATAPWTLRAFYDSLPRPFPESFGTNDASEINPLAWMNSMVQTARGGKLILSFFFTSDGPPGLHGCILKLDRPGQYKASFVDARFTKRSDAKAAVCLQAMSEGIGDYVRSIIAGIDNKVTPAMRSFSGSVVYPALTSTLSKIDTNLHPQVEYHKERDAFGATLIVNLSTLPTPDQVRRYAVPSDYRSKADAKVAVICSAAEQGVIEFVRFRGGTLPDGYTSPFSLHSRNPETSKKRKQPGSAEDGEQSQPAKKKKKGKQRAEAAYHNHLAPVGQYLSVHPSSDQTHGISGPGDMGLPRSLPPDGLCDPSQPGVGGGSGSGAAHPVVYGHGVPHNAQMYALYPAVSDPRFMGGGSKLGSRGYGVQPAAYGGGSHPLRTIDAPFPESGPSRARPAASSSALPRPSEDAELEPGEVVSCAESEFSVGSSRNDEEVAANEQEMDMNMATNGRDSDDIESVVRRSTDKGKAKETYPANTSATVSWDGPGTTTATTVISPVSHVKNLIDYCVRHGYDTPSFHEMQSQGRSHVWIVIGKERFDLPTTYGTAEEGRQRVAKQVLARFSKGPLGTSL